MPFELLILWCEINNLLAYFQKYSGKIRKNSRSAPLNHVVFIPGYVCLVDEPVSTGGGVVAREIPVAGIVGDCLMESVKTLVQDVHLGFQRMTGVRHQYIGYGMRDVVFGKWGIDGFHAVGPFISGHGPLGQACAVSVVNYICTACVNKQLYGGVECNELVKGRHVDSIIIGITHLRRRAHNDDTAWIYAVELT